MESVLEELKKMNLRLDNIDSHMGKVDDIEAKMSEIVALKDKVEKLEVQQEENNTRLDSCSKEIQTLTRLTSYLEAKVEDLENRNRRNNVIFYNLIEPSSESWDACLLTITALLRRLDLHDEITCIERAHRLGRKHSGCRPVIVRFSHYKAKISILRNSRRFSSHGVSVGEDFSQNVRAKRRELLPFLREARKRGDRASLRFDKLWINGRVFVPDTEVEDSNPVQDTRKRREMSGGLPPPPKRQFAGPSAAAVRSSSAAPRAIETSAEASDVGSMGYEEVMSELPSAPSALPRGASTRGTSGDPPLGFTSPSESLSVAVTSAVAAADKPLGSLHSQRMDSAIFPSPLASLSYPPSAPGFIPGWTGCLSGPPPESSRVSGRPSAKGKGSGHRSRSSSRGRGGSHGPKSTRGGVNDARLE